MFLKYLWRLHKQDPVLFMELFLFVVGLGLFVLVVFLLLIFGQPTTRVDLAAPRNLELRPGDRLEWQDTAGRRNTLRILPDGVGQQEVWLLPHEGLKPLSMEEFRKLQEVLRQRELENAIKK